MTKQKHHFFKVKTIFGTIETLQNVILQILATYDEEILITKISHVNKKRNGLQDDSQTSLPGVVTVCVATRFLLI
jgi:hypothetical protein